LFRESLKLRLAFPKILLESKGPGLKALVFCPSFRGLKPPAPSEIFDPQFEVSSSSLFSIPYSLSP